jgi:hypothetical protein
MVSLSLDIPGDLVTPFLSKWLDLSSVVKLDSAFCNYRSRAAFLSIAYERDVVFSLNDAAKRYSRCLSWCLKRSAKVDGFWFSEELAQDCTLRQQFLSLVGHRVRWATVGNMRCESVDNAEDHRLAVLDIVHYCPIIEDLYISVRPRGGEEGPALWDECLLTVVQTSRHVHTLSLIAVPLSSAGLVTAFIQAGQLTLLKLWNLGVHVAVPCEVAISSLTHLDIRGCARVTDALLFAVAEDCQALQTFNVFRENRITETGARALLEGCTLLRKLTCSMHTTSTERCASS